MVRTLTVIAVALLAVACQGNDQPDVAAKSTASSSDVTSTTSTTATSTTTTVTSTTTTVTSTTVPAQPPAAPAPPADAKLALPAYDPSNGTPAGRMNDVSFAGDESAGCVWLVAGDSRIAAAWEPGTTATFGPLRLFDSAGQIRWREGERVDVGGGASPVMDTIPPQCRTGDRAYWVVWLDH